MNSDRRLDRILVVDDEPHILSSIQDLLEDEFEVLTSTSPEEALGHLGKNHLAVIISDQRMPGMNGDEFLRKARESSEATRVLITGYADLDAVVRAVNNGQIYAYVAKPWDPHQLKIMVGRAVEHYELLEKLRHETNLLNTLLKSSTDSIFFKDSERRFVRVNEAAAELLGVDSPEALVGKRGEDLEGMAPDAAERARRQDEQVLVSRRPLVDQIDRFDKPHGESSWISTSKAPVVGREGEVQGLVGIGRDVSARLQAEEAVKLSEARFRDFADTASDWLWEMDADLCFSWHSDRFQEITGEDPDRLLGQRRDDSGIEGVDEESLQRHLEDLEAHRPFRNFVFARRRPDGRLAWRAISGKPVFDEAGNFKGYRGSGRDITVRKRAEEAVALVSGIATRLGEVTDVSDAFKTVLKRVCERLGWTLGEAWIPADGQGNLRMARSWVHERDESLDRYISDRAKISFEPDQGLAGRAWQNRTAEWIDDLPSQPPHRFHRRDLAVAADIKAGCAIPVVASDRVVAVLVFFLRRPNGDDPGWMDALAAAAYPLGAFLLRIAAEDAQRESEKRFRDFADIGTDWLWEMDADLRFSWFSDQVETILGISTGAFLGKRREDTLLEGVDDEALKRHIEDLEAHRPFRDFVHARRREDNGELVWISVDGDPFHDDEGNFLGYRGVGTNITDRKKAEAEIELLARFHSENPNPVLRVSEDGNIQTANGAASPLLAIWETEVGRAVPADVAVMIDDLLANNLPQQIEAEGDEQTFRLNLVPIAENRYINVYGEDITFQKKTEQKLLQMQKMEAIGQLTGGVAHDFNNRLTVMLGNLELLEGRIAGNEKALKLVRAARRAAEGGAKLTRQLLTFSRRQMLEPAVIDANALLRNLEDMIDRTLGEMVDVKLRLEHEPWPTRVDAGQLEDAILNLAVNARDAMPSGGMLTIETANVDFSGRNLPGHDYMARGEYLMVAVTDTGEGMPKEIQERIFEPFFSTKETGKGTGLGMSMVYGFVKQSKGYVNVYSETGHGTCVKLYLPRAEATTARQELPRDEEEYDRQVEKTVLVVEDDAGVREIAVTLLGESGLRVLEAENALQALEIIDRGENVDLLFTDMVMPGGMGGLDLAKKVRTQRPGIKVIFTSGYTEKGPFNGAPTDEPIHWLTKPYTRDKLTRKVREALGG